MSASAGSFHDTNTCSRYRGCLRGALLAFNAAKAACSLCQTHSTRPVTFRSHGLQMTLTSWVCSIAAQWCCRRRKQNAVKQMTPTNASMAVAMAKDFAVATIAAGG